MGDLGKLGIHAAVGVLMGIAATVWIKPDNAGGSALLIVVFTALAVIIGALLGAIRKRR